MEGALSVFCSFSQIPNTELSLLNCQDCIIAGKVQCFSPTYVRLNDTGFRGILQLYQGFQVQVFNYKANEILHHKDRLCTQCICNGSSLGFFQALLFPALGLQKGERNCCLFVFISSFSRFPQKIQRALGGT